MSKDPWPLKHIKEPNPYDRQQDVMEIGHEFADDSIYTIFIKGAAMPKYVYGHEIKHEFICSKQGISWFKPDVYGDAEAVVNAWVLPEEQKEGE